jgi:hypothetical protein
MELVCGGEEVGGGDLKGTNLNEYGCNNEVYFVWIFRLFVQYEILGCSSSVSGNLFCIFEVYVSNLRSNTDYPH